MANYGPYGSTPPPGMLDSTTLVGGGGGAFGGYSYGDPEGMGPGAVGTPSILKGAFPRMAGYLLQGSQGAAGETIKSFEEQYRHKAQGIAAGQNEMQNRLGGEVASQGLSPDIARRMLMGSNASSQAAIGSTYGEAQAGMHGELAQLLKGTGVELAQLTRDQINVIMQAYIAKKSRYKGNGLGSALGTAVGGGAGALLGGTAGASAGAKIGGTFGGAFDH